MKNYFLAIKEILEVFLVALISTFLIYKFLAQPFLVQGASMEPNFRSGDYLLVDEISYRFRDPQRGEVVIFRYPNNRSLFYVKRIIGLPYDKIEFRDGEVLANGEALEEEYLPAGVETKSFGDYKVTLEEDQYFVVGDNRSFSSDSRRWGPILREDIVGGVRLRFWPRPTLNGFN